MDSIWTQLADHHRRTADRPIADLIDAGRARDFSAAADGMIFDYARTGIDQTGRALLLKLAEASPLATRRAAMFDGERINTTEDRAVLHTALRAPDRAVTVDGTDVSIGVRDVLARMRAFANDLRAGRFTGQGGAITDVVNIGIGGSDLGPAMAVAALAPYADGPRCHFVSNIDGAHVHDVLKGLNPETTLVLVASKTFTTIETMTNAQTARDWMAARVADPAAQFAAISTALDKTEAFGIPEDRVFGFADWVGGRYSIWGPIGLSVMIAIGPDRFDDFLAGGRAMDDHFRAAPFAQNLPALLALVGIWHNQICGHATRAVLPYDQRLALLPAYLQQLEMESNGKRVGLDGRALDHDSGPVVWGAPGTNGQHAFHQLIHQGTRVIPCEFLLAAQGHEADLDHHHRKLMANALAQMAALMLGRSTDEVRAAMIAKGMAADQANRLAPHRTFPGNRPSTLLLYPRLTPFVLGQIIALYEHRVFVEGVILGINSFDQWGVELGKELALALEPAIEGKDVQTDAVTQESLARIAALRG
ncbi:glucose-6-phosphate isomerase [Paracoccus sp. p3-h83]|uniref:glucose-6-phosphate isomerase n=1 Tax=Paracoccus sp. p3-h83 TaxID=3342805 RepID=UPI0035B748CD